MRDLLDRFFELEGRTRALLGIVAVMIVAALYWNFIYAGRRVVMQETISKIEQLRDQKKAKEKLIANLDDTRDQVKKLTAELRRAEVRLPDKKEIPDLLSNVSSAGRESGLEIQLFRQKAERFQDFYAEVPVEVVVRGSYHQVATFFDRVSQLDRIVNVSDISMRTPQKGANGIQVDTSLSAVTFRFLDEQERERIAKEKAEAAKKNGKAPKKTGDKAKSGTKS
jgi:type IV pilus assembly protein PilO